MVRTLLRTLVVSALVALASPARADEADRPDSLQTIRPVEAFTLPSPARIGLVAPDKLQHASLAFASGLAIGLVTREPAAAAGGALALGLGKELWDRRRTHFDRGDLVADALGAGLAAWVTHALRR